MNQNLEKQFDESICSNLVIEEVSENVENEHVSVQATDNQKILIALEDNLKLKSEFVGSEEYSQYSQTLVISLITINFSNDDPFLRHISMVFKSIKKAIKRSLVPNYFKNKQEFKTMQENLFRIFYQDINIGFITSTGQIKSTAFIFINKNIKDLISKKITIEQKEERVRITMYFFQVENIIKIPYLPQDFKQSYIRTNKFKNDFIVLSEEQDKATSTFHAYKPEDDQIYFVKRIQLQLSQHPTFTDVFDPKNIQVWKARTLSTITHPNIIRQYDWWIEILNFQPYIFVQLEYCTYPGYISQAKNLLTYSYFYMNPMNNKTKQKMIVEILLQIINGIEYLKLKRFNHGDLKPESIMITSSAIGEIQVVLSDVNQGKESQINQTENNTFYALGMLVLHMILTFPGEPTLRNSLVTDLQKGKIDECLQKFEDKAQRYVKNRNREFTFIQYTQFLQFAKSLLTQSHFHHLYEVTDFIKSII